MSIHPQLITNAQAEIAQLLADEPDLSIDQQLLHDMIQGLPTPEVVLDRLAKEQAVAAAFADGLRALIGTLKDRLHMFDARDEKLRSIITTILDGAGLNKFTVPSATLSLRHRGPEPLRPDHPELLPSQFQRVKVEADMIEIKKFYANGGQLPGISVDNGASVLTIRRR